MWKLDEFILIMRIDLFMTLQLAADCMTGTAYNHLGSTVPPRTPTPPLTRPFVAAIFFFTSQYK